MTSLSSFALVVAVAAVSFDPASCIPFGETPPARTFLPGEPDVECSPEPLAPRSVPAVASVLGCHVRVLDRCRPTRQNLAQGLEGECAGATHLVVPTPNGKPDLVPLS